MYNKPAICEICGKLRGGRKSVDHSACAKVRKELNKTSKKKQKAKDISASAIDYFARK